MPAPSPLCWLVQQAPSLHHSAHASPGSRWCCRVWRCKLYQSCKRTGRPAYTNLPCCYWNWQLHPAYPTAKCWTFPRSQLHVRDMEGENLNTRENCHNLVTRGFVVRGKNMELLNVYHNMISLASSQSSPKTPDMTTLKSGYRFLLLTSNLDIWLQSLMRRWSEWSLHTYLFCNSRSLRGDPTGGWKYYSEAKKQTLSYAAQELRGDSWDASRRWRTWSLLTYSRSGPAQNVSSSWLRRCHSSSTLMESRHIPAEGAPMRWCCHSLGSQQWWASYFHKVTELLYFRYYWKKLATFNPLPIFPSNGSVTVTSYWYFKCNESVTSYYKM